MLKNTIKISGKITDSEIKEKDGKYYLILNTSLDKKENTKSLVYVDIRPKIYNNIKDSYKNSHVVIAGSVQAKKTKKEVPYIFVKCENFSLVTNKKKIKKIDKELEIENKEVDLKPSEKEIKKIFINWYDKMDKEDFELIETAKVGLVEDEHLKATMFFNKECKYDDRPIAVRKLDDGTYTLVTGFKCYVYAKLLNKPYIKAHITQLSCKEFKDKYVDVY